MSVRIRPWGPLYLLFKYMKDWKTVKKGDYLYAKVPDHPNATSNGYVLEHRVVVERYLGRYLDRKELVHHIDENKKNNEIENLRVMSPTDHNNLHKRKLVMVQHNCPNCGIDFIRRPKGKNEPNEPKCSRRCNGQYSKKIQMGLIKPYK